MAFCPHCGKAVAEQASKCLACGKELGTPAAPARFKGTMMMQAPAPAVPADKAAGKPAAEASPAPASTEPSGAAAEPKSAAVEAPKPVKKALKGTMIGGMAAPVPPVQAAPAPAPAPEPAPPAAPQPATDAAAPRPDQAAAGADGRFLVGDPMAPPDATPAHVPIAPRIRPAYQDEPQLPTGGGRVIAIAVGGMVLMAAIAALVGYQLGLF